MSEAFVQKDQGFLTYPSGGWRKALFKWPVHLWRLGLGPVIGQQMVLISHTGRKTGLTRRTMTELHVVKGKKYAPSGFGRRAQWYRNIEADPRVTIQTAAGAESAIARRVTDGDELLSLMDLEDPMNRVMLRSFLATLEIEPTEADILAKKDRIYYLRFDPTDEPTPTTGRSGLVVAGGVVRATYGLAIDPQKRIANTDRHRATRIRVNLVLNAGLFTKVEEWLLDALRRALRSSPWFLQFPHPAGGAAGATPPTGKCVTGSVLGYSAGRGARRPGTQHCER